MMSTHHSDDVVARRAESEENGTSLTEPLLPPQPSALATVRSRTEIIPSKDDSQISMHSTYDDSSHNNDGNEEEDDDDERTETEEEEESTLCQSKLFLFKVLYFLNGLSGATWGRFGIIYYNEVQHLNEEQIGILQGVMPLVGFVSMPLWGYVADMIQSRKIVYVFCKGMATISLLLMSVCGGFYGTLICVIGMATFRSSGVLDAHTLDFLGNKHRDLYGTLRLWTAISWGLGAVIMGWITDLFGFEINFILFATMMTIVLLVTAIGLPARSQNEQARYDRINNQSNGVIVVAQDDEQEIEQDDESPIGNNNDGGRDENRYINDNDEAARPPEIRTLVQSICQIPVICWLLEVAVIGAGMSLVDAFLFVYLQNTLDAPTELCGYTVGITVIFELPIFRYSKSLLKSCGHDWLFLIAMSAYTIRVIGYTVLTPTTVYWILPLEILHGITFACMWIASIDFAARVAPPEWSTTFQSFLSMTMTCLGGGIGPILGGYIMQNYGPILLYQGTGIIVATVTIIHSIFFFCFSLGHDAFLKHIEETGN